MSLWSGTVTAHGQGMGRESQAAGGSPGQGSASREAGGETHGFWRPKPPFLPSFPLSRGVSILSHRLEVRVEGPNGRMRTRGAAWARAQDSSISVEGNVKPQGSFDDGNPSPGAVPPREARRLGGASRRSPGLVPRPLMRVLFPQLLGQPDGDIQRESGAAGGDPGGQGGRADPRVHAGDADLHHHGHPGQGEGWTAPPPISPPRGRGLLFPPSSPSLPSSSPCCSPMPAAPSLGRALRVSLTIPNNPA